MNFFINNMGLSWIIIDDNNHSMGMTMDLDFWQKLSCFSSDLASLDGVLFVVLFYGSPGVI